MLTYGCVREDKLLAGRREPPFRDHSPFSLLIHSSDCAEKPPFWGLFCGKRKERQQRKNWEKQLTRALGYANIWPLGNANYYWTGPSRRPREETMVPLTLAGPGEERYIKQIGGRTETRQFLESMGFVTGTMVKVLSEMSGNVIVQVKDARVAISKEMACKIMV